MGLIDVLGGSGRDPKPQGLRSRKDPYATTPYGHAMPRDNAKPVPVEPRRSTELDSAEALRLLGSVSLGRIVFTRCVHTICTP